MNGFQIGKLKKSGILKGYAELLGFDPRTAQVPQNFEYFASNGENTYIFAYAKDLGDSGTYLSADVHVDINDFNGTLTLGAYTNRVYVVDGNGAEQPVKSRNGMLEGRIFHGCSVADNVTTGGQLADGLYIALERFEDALTKLWVDVEEDYWGQYGRTQDDRAYAYYVTGEDCKNDLKRIFGGREELVTVTGVKDNGDGTFDARFELLYAGNPFGPTTEIDAVIRDIGLDEYYNRACETLEYELEFNGYEVIDSEFADKHITMRDESSDMIGATMGATLRKFVVTIRPTVRKAKKMHKSRTAGRKMKKYDYEVDDGWYLIEKDGWYYYDKGVYTFFSTRNADVFDALSSDEKKKLMREVFEDEGWEWAFELLYEKNWKYDDFQNYVVENLHENFYEDYAEYYGYFYIEEGNEVPKKVIY